MKSPSKYLGKLKTHKLATLPLRDLLWMAEPITPAEKRIIASLARAYDRMGDTFPTKQLGNDLDGLYSQAFSAARGAQLALQGLAAVHNMLSLEIKGLSIARMTARSRKKTVRAWSEAFHAVDRDLTPALMRCNEAPFLALAAASKQIKAAVKAAKKKK